MSGPVNMLNLSCLYERCLAEVKAQNCSLSYHYENDICQLPDSICTQTFSKMLESRLSNEPFKDGYRFIM